MVYNIYVNAKPKNFTLFMNFIYLNVLSFHIFCVPYIVYLLSPPIESVRGLNSVSALGTAGTDINVVSWWQQISCQ